MTNASNWTWRLAAGVAGATLATLAALAAPALARAAADWGEPRFRGYTGEGWNRDYGVRRGRCLLDEVAEAVGLDERVPVLVGDLLEGAAAQRIGPAIDPIDRTCAGIVLELLDRGRAAHWQNPGTSIAFAVRPVRNLDAACREFEFSASQRGRRNKNTLRACRDADARWQVVVRN